MPKKPRRGPKKSRGGAGGTPGGTGRGGAGGGSARSRAARGGGKRGGPTGPSGGRSGRPAPGRKSDYFIQPGRQGVFTVLRRPIGNRADAKICGAMPSRNHAKMLIQQLERAESVVKDLFMEATDDGIEALEAVLAACREEVSKRGPEVRAQGEGMGDEPGQTIDPEFEEDGAEPPTEER